MIFTEIFILFKFFYVVNFLIFNFQNLIYKKYFKLFYFF